MDEHIKYIADFYGREKQSNQAVEELNELAVAIRHYEKRKSSEDRKNLLEEIADAEIMLEQIKYMYGIPDGLIQKIKDEKICRQIERIKEDE